MRASRFHLNTLKEAPADAEVVSQKLMLRAGMIRKVAAGIYDYMPLALRSIRKIEAIVRSELNRAGALEISMPLVQPAELWRETGRWDKMGLEMLRLRDRHERDFALQPTSEEVVTDIARQELKSYRQLPRNFYQIQTKFRDERRPRFGLMRGREFIMKDGYSFDRDAEAAGKSYDAMFSAYQKIFNRIGLRYRAVAADTGAIGGDRSHEFQVIAETGEDAIVYCPHPGSDYAANIELAEALALLPARAAASAQLVRTATPGRETCAEVAEFLGVPLTSTVKSLVLASDNGGENGEGGQAAATTIWLLLIRGDHELNEVKVGKIEGLKAGFRFATEAEIVEHFGCKPGYLGPIALKKPVRVVADRTVVNMADFICGANAEGYHC
ncbi:MAG: proline--tRNA ligase, partial [Azoarcus sp.]|nr:proline--tRNA ligase [Azoarcus sp.]